MPPASLSAVVSWERPWSSRVFDVEVRPPVVRFPSALWLYCQYIGGVYCGRERTEPVGERLRLQGTQMSVGEITR